MTTPSDTAHPEGERELLPCPFCGSPAALEQYDDHHGHWFNLGCSRHWGAPGYQPETACPGGRVWYTADPDDLPKAIADWNTRSTPPSRPQGEEAAILKDCRSAIGEWIGFSASVIKSGEPWTPACEDRYQKARQGLEGLSIQPWKCAAQTANHGPHDPPECNWPLCGCDPKANKVIEALEEIGGPLSVVRPQGEEGLWRPISEAPRDGTIFWALRVHRDPKYRPSAYEAKYETLPLPHGVSIPRCHNLSANRWDEPTHWQPLPALPALSNQGKPSS